LFYNTPTRLKAFRNVNEEYNRILDIVSRYAIHSAGIGFSCKKVGIPRGRGCGCGLKLIVAWRYFSWGDDPGKSQYPR